MTVRRISVAAIQTYENYPQPVENPVIDVKPGWRGLRASLRPLLLLSKAWGVAPLTMNSSGPVTSSKIFFTLFIATLLTSTHIAAIIIVVTFEPSARHVRYVAGTGEAIFNRLCGVLNHIFLILYRKTFVSAVASIVALDDEWKPANSERAAIYVYLELVTLYVVTVAELYSIIGQPYTWPSMIFEIWNNLAIIHSLSLLILQWTNLVLSLAHHMETLTVELDKLYPEANDEFATTKPPAINHWMFLLVENEVGQGSRNNPQFHPKTSETSVTIPSLRKLHRDIHSALQKLQTVYGGPLTIGFSIVIVNTVIAVFELKHQYSTSDKLEFAWASWSVLLTYLMVMPCQMLLEKTQKCADILHSAMQNDIRPEERKQLLDFSVQLLDLPLTCSSCNFFLLDNRKLISVLGTIVTYVIILSQFDSSGQRTDGFTNITNCSAPEF